VRLNESQIVLIHGVQPGMLPPFARMLPRPKKIAIFVQLGKSGNVWQTKLSRSEVLKF